MTPRFPKRESLGPDRVFYHCSVCRRPLWPDADAASRHGFTDEHVAHSIAIRMPRPDMPKNDPRRKWDGLVFCPDHAIERGIT